MLFAGRFAFYNTNKQDLAQSLKPCVCSSTSVCVIISDYIKWALWWRSVVCGGVAKCLVLQITLYVGIKS